MNGVEEKKREEKRKTDQTRHELFSLVCLDLGAASEIE